MRGAIVAVLVIAGAGPAGGQERERRLPDSPTGRAAGAWLDLLAEPPRLEPTAFADEWLTPEAARDVPALEALVADCRGRRPRAIRRTGPRSANVELAPGDVPCRFAFELEAEPPHRIARWDRGADGASPGGDDAHGLAASGVAWPDLVVPEGGDPAAAADAWLEELAAAGAFSGAVLVARDGVPVFEGSYGLADRESGAPVTAATRFDVGSITKAFTRVAVGQLLRDGRLGLDDTVARHLPDYPDPEAARRITVAHLLDHSSGLGDIFGDRYHATPIEELIRPRDFFPLFAGQPLAFDPGTSQQYSNAGYVVLGAVVEAVTGEDYAAWVSERVFAPSGMDASGFLRKDGSVPDVAVGYTQLSPSGEQGPLVSNRGRLPIRGCPAGSSSHTARDLLRFDRALRSGALLGAWTGWFFGDDPPVAGGESRPVAGAGYGIAGGGPGVNAVIEGEGDATLVVLANLDPPVAGRVAEQLREILRAPGSHE